MHGCFACMYVRATWECLVLTDTTRGHHLLCYRCYHHLAVINGCELPLDAGMEIGSPRRAAKALTCWAIPPALLIPHFFKKVLAIPFGWSDYFMVPRLPHTPRCWDYRWVLLYLAQPLHFNFLMRSSDEFMGLQFRMVIKFYVCRASRSSS